jgi:hypothetical protein
MKPLHKILLGALLLSGLQFAFSGCVAGGSVGVSEGVYYGPNYGGPWFHDGPWMDGRRGYRDGGHVGVYIHPPRAQSSRPSAPPHHR